MRKKQKKQIERIISSTGIALLGIIAFKFNQQYNKKTENVEQLKSNMKRFENIFISNVMDEILRRQKEGQLTDYEKYRIITDTDISKELQNGIMEIYPTPYLYIEEKLRVARSSGNHIKK